MPNSHGLGKCEGRNKLKLFSTKKQKLQLINIIIRFCLESMIEFFSQTLLMRLISASNFLKCQSNIRFCISIILYSSLSGLLFSGNGKKKLYKNDKTKKKTYKYELYHTNLSLRKKDSSLPSLCLRNQRFLYSVHSGSRHHCSVGVHCHPGRGSQIPCHYNIKTFKFRKLHISQKAKI